MKQLRLYILLASGVGGAYFFNANPWYSLLCLGLFMITLFFG